MSVTRQSRRRLILPAARATAGSARISRAMARTARSIATTRPHSAWARQGVKLLPLDHGVEIRRGTMIQPEREGLTRLL